MALAGSAAWAQAPRVDVSGTAGGTFSDGVKGEASGIVTRSAPQRINNHHGYLAWNYEH